MFSAILAIMLLPITDLGRSKGLQFRPLSKIAFFIFVANFLVLMQLGAKHVESPFIEFGQISSILYFSHFVFIVPFVSILENTLMDLSFITNGNCYSTKFTYVAGYNFTQIRWFSTTRRLNADPLGYAALSYATTNVGVLPIYLVSSIPALIGLGIFLIRLINNDCHMVDQDINVHLQDTARAFDSLMRVYFHQLNDILETLRGVIFEEVTREELHSIRIHLLRMITINEVMYDELSNLVSSTVTDMDLGHYNYVFNDVREIGNRLTEIYRLVENEHFLDQYITRTMPQF